MSLRPKMAAISLFATVLCLDLLKAAEPPNEWFFRAWQTEHGLPDNSISSVAQTPDGYLWVATKGGLMRFNGADFKTMSLRRFPGLPSRAIRVMHLDRQGQVWVGMERGPLIRIGTQKVRAFFPRDGIFPDRIKSMAEDSTGRIWVAFMRGICLIDGDEVIQFGEEHSIPLRGQSNLTSDADGTVWLAKNNEVGVLSDQGFEKRLTFESTTIKIAGARSSGLLLSVDSELMTSEDGEELKNLASLPANSVTTVLYQDSEGAIWIGTSSHGLFRFQGDVLQSIPTSHPAIECVSEDREGNIWVGTVGGGLNLVKPRTVELIKGTRNVPISSIQSVSASPDGKIWAATDDGQLVSLQHGKWSLESAHETFNGVWVSCVTVDETGLVWAGTRSSGLLVHQDGQWKKKWLQPAFPKSFIRSLFTAENGDVWAATDFPFKLHRMRGDAMSSWDIEGPIEFIRAFAEGPDGTIWAASSDGRIVRIQDDVVSNEDAITEPLPLSVRTLHVTSDGSLWIGYAGDGLGHLKDGRYSRLTTHDGLYDDYISQLQEDQMGSLWISANRGLFQVNLADLLEVTEGKKKQLRSRAFGPNDGLPSVQPSRNFAPTAARSPDGNLWFAMSRGLLKAKPNLIKENPEPPPVLIESVTIDDQQVATYKSRSLLPEEVLKLQVDLSAPSPSLKFAPGHDKMEIDFAALSLASPENVHFLYRLTPFDRNWIEARSIRSATYPRLPAGRYQFEVIACNNVGVWNETGASLEIMVEPFFWETWWFKIGGGIGTALGAGGVVFFWLHWGHKRQLIRIAEKRTLEQERSRIARDIHDDLGASLTRITLLSQSTPTADIRLTQDVLDQIHATARHLMRSMEEVVWAVNPEHDTFDALANYLSNYGQSFLGIAGVRCRLEMPVVLPDRPLSAQVRHNLFLAFKEALNNAVKYAEASEVRISLSHGESRLFLRVADNGKGIDASPSSDPTRTLSGSGLANMKTRMEEIGGSCTLNSSQDEGTSIEFEVPFRTNS